MEGYGLLLFFRQYAGRHNIVDLLAHVDIEHDSADAKYPLGLRRSHGYKLCDDLRLAQASGAWPNCSC